MPLGVTVSVAEGEPSPSAHELFSVYFVGQERTWSTSDAGESQDSGRLWDRGRVSGPGWNSASLVRKALLHRHGPVAI